MKLLDGLSARKFEDIRGARINGAIPVTEKALNEAVSSRISAAHGRIQQVGIQIGSDNYLEMGIKVAVGPFSKWFRPEVTLRAQAQPALIVVTLASREYAPLMWLVELFAKELFPKGLTIRDQQIVVNIAELPAIAEYNELLGYLKKLDISSGPGAMSLLFEIEIN
ncbi:MAG TPA: hypothetical protein VEX68_15270 [Bryobacteraceae bacterium]|nr:hypothetical protein [Bryobacteraceae bacterium]